MPAEPMPAEPMPADPTSAGIERSPASHRPSPGTLVAAVVFGLFYAYDVWEALGNLLQLPQLDKANHLDTASVPWAFLIAGVVSPILIYFLSLLIARRQRLFGRCVILFVGLAAAAALSLSFIELSSLREFASLPSATGRRRARSR